MLRAGWRAVVAVGVGAALFVASCGGDDDDSSSGSASDRAEPTDDTTTGATGTDTTAARPEEAAVQIYLDGNDFIEEAVAAYPVNPEDPALADYFSGSALSENRSLLVQLRQAGEYYQTSFEGHPEVASATSDEVILTDCVSESTTSFDGASGQQKDTGQHVYNWRIQVVNTDSGWRVNEITPQEQSCTP